MSIVFGRLQEGLLALRHRVRLLVGDVEVEADRGVAVQGARHLGPLITKISYYKININIECKTILL